MMLSPMTGHRADVREHQSRLTHEAWKRADLDYGRKRWGWGIFILRAA